MDARNGVLPAVRVAGPGSQGGRGLGGALGVAAQGPDRLQGLGLGAGGGDEDEVRFQGARGEELVDEALADAEADAAVRDA